MITKSAIGAIAPSLDSLFDDDPVLRWKGFGFAGDDDDHRKPHTLSATRPLDLREDSSDTSFVVRP